MSSTTNQARAPVEVRRGLTGVYFDRSAVSHIDGRAGALTYRGYSIDELARFSTFEETAYLLIHGELPTAAELEDFESELMQCRELPEAAYSVIRSLKDAHPMEALRTVVSLLGSFAEADGDRSNIVQKGIRLLSQVPVAVAAHHRIRSAGQPICPNKSLPNAANFLYMLDGKVPEEKAARLLDIDLILHAEHGSNASSFAARVVAGTGASLHAAMTAAVGALSGPSHGGAAEHVAKMIEEIGCPENAVAYVRKKRANREPIMGFGHRVYRAEDPRARHMRSGLKDLLEEAGEHKSLEILEALEEAMLPYARHGVGANVDLYAGMVYWLCGVPQDLFVPVFAIGRTPGWVAQIVEQLNNNILIRPLTVYDGPAKRDYKPINQRL